MDIRELLLRHPGVTIADESENAEILDFFSSTQIQGQELQIKYDRSPDFFTFLRLHSNEYLVFLYRGIEGTIQGVGTLVIRSGYVNGVLEKVCYLGDLRMGFDRKGAVIWRKVYSDLLKYQGQIDQLKKVKKFYTCLIDDNRRSQLSLANNRKAGFKYHRVCPYSMITLIAKKPSLRFRNNSPQTVFPVADLEELLKFYRSNEAVLECGYAFSSEINRRLQRWDNFKTDNFIVIKDGERIIASCAMWSPQGSKKILLSKIPFFLKLVFAFFKLLSLGSFKFNGELKVLYVTHLMFDRNLSLKEKSAAFKLILDEAWVRRQELGCHFLSFCDFKKASLKESATGYFNNEVAMALYEVQEIEMPEPNQQEVYGFEMALV